MIHVDSCWFHWVHPHLVQGLPSCESKRNLAKDVWQTGHCTQICWVRNDLPMFRMHGWTTLISPHTTPKVVLVVWAQGVLFHVILRKFESRWSCSCGSIYILIPHVFVVQKHEPGSAKTEEWQQHHDVFSVARPLGRFTKVTPKLLRHGANVPLPFEACSCWGERPVEMGGICGGFLSGQKFQKKNSSIHFWDGRFCWFLPMFVDFDASIVTLPLDVRGWEAK